LYRVTIKARPATTANAVPADPRSFKKPPPTLGLSAEPLPSRSPSPSLVQKLSFSAAAARETFSTSNGWAKFLSRSAVFEPIARFAWLV
jgi:hypothetical protein